jgi:hypothetical protein
MSQSLVCRKCLTTGTVEYDGTRPKLRFLAHSGSFQFNRDSARGTERINCQCGNLLYFARLRKVASPNPH